MADPTAPTAYAATDFAGTSAGEKQKRELLMTFVNVAAFGANYHSTPTWELEGAGVEESTHSYEFEEETTNDILGHTETDVKALNETQEMDMDIRKGNKLQFKLIDILERRNFTEFSGFEILKVRKYLDEGSGFYHAELHKDCTIRPNSEGGSAGNVTFPIRYAYSGDRTLGTVSFDGSGNPTFVALS